MTSKERKEESEYLEKVFPGTDPDTMAKRVVAGMYHQYVIHGQEAPEHIKEMMEDKLSHEERELLEELHKKDGHFY